MPTFYPGAVAVLTCRIDDRRTMAPPLLRVMERFGGSAPPGGGPRDLNDPEASFVSFSVRPRRVAVRRNRIREADTCTLSIDAAELPLDPRWLRACAVEVYISDRAPDVYGSHMAAGMVPRVPLEQSTRRFVGWADDGRWSLAEGEFTGEFRDFKALLLDAKIKASLLAGVDMGQSLLLAVWHIVQAHPSTQGMRVVARGIKSSSDIPVMAQAYPRQFIRVKGGPKSKSRHVPLEEGADSYWELITRLCVLVGWVPTVEIDRVVLQPARTLWLGAQQQNQVEWVAPNLTARPARAAFRRTVNGELLQARRMVWGVNLESLEFRRPWGEVSRRQVELRAHVPGTAQVLVSHYPPPAKPAKQADYLRKANLSPGLGEEEKDLVLVDGVASQAALDAAALNVWHERALRELQARFSTRDLYSLGGGPGDQDLLDMLSGDTVEIRVAGNLEQGSTFETLAAMNQPELIAALQQRGLDAKSSAAVAAAVADRTLSSFFRADAVELVIDASEGATVSVESSIYFNAGLVEAQGGA